MITVRSAVEIYEIDGREVAGPPPRPEIIVTSHPTRRVLIVIVIDDKRYTVSADDMLAAVRNAENRGR
jgi:hypothetical protein